MILFRPVRLTLAVLFAAGLCGCSPSGQSQLDEEREAHFLAGKSRANAMDYKGAIESFTKAVEVNPRSASAHLELGLLCEKNEMDFAAAIYHFERFLKLRPNSDYAEIVRQRILACKQELAKTVSLGPVTQMMQREFEQLAEDNRRLRAEVEKWRLYYAQRGGPRTNPPPGIGPPSRPGTPAGTAQISPRDRNVPPAPGSAQGGAGSGSGTGANAAARTHKVQPGETPAGIARKYSVKVESLLAANPGLNPKRLQIGQSVNVPAP